MLLIVDDDPSVVASLTLLLKQAGHRALGVGSPEEALRALDENEIDLVLQDMNFSRETSGEEGLALLESIHARDPNLPVILITAWGSIALAVEGMKRGAADFVTKPWTNAQIVGVVDTVLGVRQARVEDLHKTLERAALESKYDLAGIIGEDPGLLRMLDLAGRVAPTDASVLITGESGTGKELVAEMIHRNSPRRGRPFVKVNLGGISSTLFESEMFGHVRGAFTDARENRKGRFELADGGTIFLDEIGETDLNAQVKLLRVLQDRSYELLGSSATRTVDVRVISATNRSLAEMVDADEFREDLLYRLNQITIHLPPLRARRDDVVRLARWFVARCAAAYRRDAIELSRDAEEWLSKQPWPGNIRQLRQVIERAVLIRDGDHLTAGDFNAVTEIDRPRASSGDLPAAGSMTLDEMERAMIEKCLRHYEGNVTRVAEALGLSRPALYRRLEKYGLESSRS